MTSVRRTVIVVSLSRQYGAVGGTLVYGPFSRDKLRQATQILRDRHPQALLKRYRLRPLSDDKVYAIDEHHRPDLPWPVEADHWFWQIGDRWVAVVADWHEDWWEGSDPEETGPRPAVWRVPIDETPPHSGTLVFRGADGQVQERSLIVPRHELEIAGDLEREGGWLCVPPMQAGP